MQRRAAALIPLLALVFFSACNRDAVTGLPAIAARSEAGPKTLTDAIAFFTRQFNTVDGGLAVMSVDGSGRPQRQKGRSIFGLAGLGTHAGWSSRM